MVFKQYHTIAQLIGFKFTKKKMRKWNKNWTRHFAHWFKENSHLHKPVLIAISMIFKNTSKIVMNWKQFNGDKLFNLIFESFFFFLRALYIQF